MCVMRAMCVLRVMRVMRVVRVVRVVRVMWMMRVMHDNTTHRYESQSGAEEKRGRVRERCSSLPARWVALMWSNLLATPQLMTRDEYFYENDCAIGGLQ